MTTKTIPTLMTHSQAKLGRITIEDAYNVAFSACRKVKAEDRLDMVQHCIETLVQCKQKVTGKAIAYGICAHKVEDYWRNIHKHWQDSNTTWQTIVSDSLNRKVFDEDGSMTELGHRLIGYHYLADDMETKTLIQAILRQAIARKNKAEAHNEPELLETVYTIRKALELGKLTMTTCHVRLTPMQKGAIRARLLNHKLSQGQLQALHELHEKIK